jgi:hypothetical protein
MSHNYAQEFNATISVDHVIRSVGGYQIQHATQFNYDGQNIFSEYWIPFRDGYYGKLDVSVDITRNNKLSIRFMYKELVLDTYSNAFELYLNLPCCKNRQRAVNWKTDARLHVSPDQCCDPPSLPVPIQPTFQQQQNYSQQSAYCNAAPLIDIEFAMDQVEAKRCLNLQDCIHNKQTFVFALTAYLATICEQPFSTVLLVLLGVFSSMTKNKWRVAYPDNRTVAIGLYILAEQPSGTSKSRMVDFGLEPLHQMIQPAIKQLQNLIDTYQNTADEYVELLASSTTATDKADCKGEIAKMRTQIKKLSQHQTRIQCLLPLTNATQESMDGVLSESGGYVSTVSSEQGGIDVTLGLTSGKKHNNNDTLLNGREGGIVNSRRVGRKGYSGRVVNSLTFYAQDLTIGKFFAASGVTGLAERCLCISEPSSLGYRDHLMEKPKDIYNIVGQYAQRCEFFQEVIENPIDYDDLVTLRITDEDWRCIYSFENELEQQLRDKRELSHPVLQRVVGKTKMQLIGLSANLYLLDTSVQPLSHNVDLFIPTQYVRMAIDMFRRLIDGMKDYCIRSGLMSNKEQIRVMYNFFIDKSPDISFTMAELKKKGESVNPFKTLHNPRIAIKETIDYLNNNNVLIKRGDRYYRNLIPYNPLTSSIV